MPARHIFCPKCHQLAAEIRTDDENTKIIQGGKTLINLSKQSKTSISVNCPNGHGVKVEI